MTPDEKQILKAVGTLVAVKIVVYVVIRRLAKVAGQ